MSFKTLRERRLLSQEQIAEASGLSLRTVQRVEAGHRVSYASLRALATTFQMDVDLLERELYAVNKSADEFVEIPRWVRFLNGEGWFPRDAPRPSRRDALVIETAILGLAVVLLVLSFVVTKELQVRVLRYGAFFEVIVCYVISVLIRIVDQYRLWPAADVAFGAPRPPESGWLNRGRVIGYTLYLLVPLLLMTGVLALARYLEIGM